MVKIEQIEYACSDPKIILLKVNGKETKAYAGLQINEEQEPNFTHEEIMAVNNYLRALYTLYTFTRAIERG